MVRSAGRGELAQVACTLVHRTDAPREVSNVLRRDGRRRGGTFGLGDENLIARFQPGDAVLEDLNLFRLCFDQCGVVLLQ